MIRTADAADTKPAAGDRPRKPRLLLLHGFLGSPASYVEVEQRLQEVVDCLCPMLLGHGRERFAPAEVGFEGEVNRLARFVLNHSFSPCHICGYSMGARLGLGLVVRYPQLFSGAMLIGVHPGLADPTARSERRRIDANWAKLLQREGISLFADIWESQPLFATEAILPIDRRRFWHNLRRSHSPAGLVVALRHLGLAEMPDYAAALATIAIPVHLVVGEKDQKFTQLALRMQQSLPHSTVTVIAGAGHNLLAEQPERIVSILMKELR